MSMRSRFQLPTWARWAIPFGIAIVLIVAVVIFVDANQNDSNRATAGNQAEQQAEQRQDYTLVQQQQAPHVVALAAHADPQTAATSTVVAYLKGQISHGFINGPYDHGSCQASGGSSARQAFTCRLVTNIEGSALTYPFDVVVQPALNRLTWCQVVTPATPSLRVPVSASCR